MTRDDVDYIEERLLSISKLINDSINSRAERHVIIDEFDGIRRIVNREKFLEEQLETVDAEISCFLADCEELLD